MKTFLCWLGFIPAACAAYWLSYILVMWGNKMMINVFTVGLVNSFVVVLISKILASVASSAIYMYIGFVVAPSDKGAISSIILGVLATIFLVISNVMAALQGNTEIIMIVESIISLITIWFVFYKLLMIGFDIRKIG